MMFLLAALFALPAKDDGITIADAVAANATPSTMRCGFGKRVPIDFSHDSSTVRVYHTCFVDEELPHDGAHCTVTFHAERIGEWVARPQRIQFMGNVLDKMTCDPSVEPPHRPYHGVTITEYGKDPVVGSGVLMVIRRVSITTAEGEALKLYFINGGHDGNDVPNFINGAQGELYPAIGSKCDFETSPFHVGDDDFSYGPSFPLGQLIDTAHCTPPQRH